MKALVIGASLLISLCSSAALAAPSTETSPTFFRSCLDMAAKKEVNDVTKNTVTAILEMSQQSLTKKGCYMARKALRSTEKIAIKSFSIDTALLGDAQKVQSIDLHVASISSLQALSHFPELKNLMITAWSYDDYGTDPCFECGVPGFYITKEATLAGFEKLTKLEEVTLKGYEKIAPESMSAVSHVPNVNLTAGDWFAE